MNDRKLCAGRSAPHSLNAWYWVEVERTYRRECSILGCGYVENSNILNVRGRIENPMDETCSHSWSTWKTTADPFGTYIPPWRYERRCSLCKIIQRVEDLEGGK